MTDINKINPKPIERSLNGFDKPFETVYELKKDEYQILSFEEFMKNYEVDEKVESSYESELGSYGDIGIEKDYGPCGYSRCPQPSSLRFNLQVRGINEVWWGGSSANNFEDNANNVKEAIEMIDKIDEGRGCWEEKIRGPLGNFAAFFGVGVEGMDGVEYLTRQIRNKLIELIREAIRKHENGQYVDGKITVREGGGGGLTWRTSY